MAYAIGASRLPRCGRLFRPRDVHQGGSTWSTLQSFGDVSNNAAWAQATSTAGAGTSVVFRVRVSNGTASGNLVEGGIDDVSICDQ